MKRIISLLILVSLSSCNDVNNNVITDFEHLTPRPFGYVIGDEIAHRVIIETRDGVKLNQANLPTQGILNRWLNLNQINVTEKPLHGGYHYEIDLTYQVFYAPQAAKMLTIPSVALNFNQAGNALEKTIPAWQFTLSALREIQMRKDEHGEYMRPNEPAPFLSTPHAIETSLFSLASFVFSGTWLAYFYGFISLPRRKIFKQTNQKLLKLKENDLEQGFALMHNALNTLNGKPLFASQLAHFYEKNPQYETAKKLLNDFFQISTRYFFAGQNVNSKDTLQLIRKTCELCSAIERGQR
jgi:mxaA protein